MELKKRIKTGSVLVAVGIAVIYFSYLPYFLNTVCFLISVIGAYELFRCSGNVKTIFIAVSVLYCAFTQFAPLSHFDVVCPAALAIALAVFIVMMRKVSSFHIDSPLRIVPFVLLIPLLIRSASEIRLHENGLIYLVFAELGCISTDVSAYFLGKRFGKRKLAPTVSPGKTVAGAVGGLVLSTIVLTMIAVLLTHFGIVKVNYYVLLPYLIDASLIGQFGDLSFSAIKRCAGIKDFGNILPGHGGILDRFDSLIFTAPFLYSILLFADFFI